MTQEKLSVLESIKMDDIKDFGQKKLETMFVRNGFALLRFTDKNLDVSKVLVVTMDDKKCQQFGESMDFYGSAKNENFQQACCSFYNTFKTHIKFYEEHNMVPDMVIKNGASDQEKNPEYKGADTQLFRDNGDSDYSVDGVNYSECRWIDVVQQTMQQLLILKIIMH